MAVSRSPHICPLGVAVVTVLLYAQSPSVYADPMAQAPGSVPNASANIAGITILPSPPQGFNPLDASDTELALHGFPPRPNPNKDAVGYAHWSRLVTAAKTVATNQHLSQAGPKFGSRGQNDEQT